ncbi:PP2C family protein-serine/threonine phosphatase [Streptomyces sp. NPDC001652]|uniref:PP2C family protein-serine/threonine phosphatase n=1 Tax=Streptomyces sp. NPDC001652 TaxID=3154393 RepID=UPI00332D1438
MNDQDRDGGKMLAGLLASSQLIPLEWLPAKTAEHAAYAGFTQALIYLADLQREMLHLLTGQGLDAAGDGGAEESSIKIEGTLPGRAYQYGQVLHGSSSAPEERQWWVPLLNGTERLGVLRLTTHADDARTRESMELLASLLALIIVSKRQSSDSYARLMRTEPLNIAAEMQWHLMPPPTYADSRVAISAAMEPAHHVSGDAYDYATGGSMVHVSIFDAMGHDTAAGLTAALAMGTCRNTRRQGGSLLDIGEAIEQALLKQYDRTRYVTGILADLDTDTGVLTWVNRGHLPPLLIRSGRSSSQLTCKPAHPMGTALGLEATMCREQLEPGDRVVFYTDGITEARGRGDIELGVERFTDLLLRHHADGLPVPETLRRLIQTLLEHHDGQLQDDATILICRWLGSAPALTADETDRD